MACAHLGNKEFTIPETLFFTATESTELVGGLMIFLTTQEAGNTLNVALIHALIAPAPTYQLPLVKLLVTGMAISTTSSATKSSTMEHCTDLPVINVMITLLPLIAGYP